MKRFSLFLVAVVALGCWLVYAQTTVYDAGQYKVISGTATVTNPSLVQATNGVAITALAAISASLDGKVLTRQIQNVGTNAVYYCLGGTAATTNYHGILKSSTAVLDGTGGILELSNYAGSISVCTATSTSLVATLQFYR